LDPLIKSQLLYHLSYAPSAGLARSLCGARQPGRGRARALPARRPGATKGPERGCSSVVEQKLPKLRVEGSIPFTRSKENQRLSASGPPLPCSGTAPRKQAFLPFPTSTSSALQHGGDPAGRSRRRQSPHRADRRAQRAAAISNRSLAIRSTACKFRSVLSLDHS
jgi:hypothetical protein